MTSRSNQKLILRQHQKIKILFIIFIQNAQIGGPNVIQKKKPKAQTGIFANKAPRALFCHRLHKILQKSTIFVQPWYTFILMKKKLSKSVRTCKNEKGEQVKESKYSEGQKGQIRPH